MEDEIHVLTWSTNAGRYCFDDPEHGHDVTSVEPLASEMLNGLWAEGQVDHSGGGYHRPGSYPIAAIGHHAERKRQRTEGALKHAISEGLDREAWLEDAIRADIPLVEDLFYGYYFLTRDGQAIGLCIGMRVRQR